jgi:formylglycine-generating enzyme
MGAADHEEDERPIHRVYVSEFFIGRFPVTQDDYARFVRETGYPAPAVRSLPLIASGHEATFKELAAPYAWQNAEPPSGRGSHPVVLVTYEDTLAYCQWLSDELKRVARLPTEAEWEKAARCGTEANRYPWGPTIDSSHANFLCDPAVKKHEHGTRPTGTYAPNEYGLYDMIGNVWEWVSDWYAADYYGQGEMRDPRGPDAGNLRIVRGGSWVNDDVSMLRCAYRHKVPPDTYAYSMGFRIVCNA